MAFIRNILTLALVCTIMVAVAEESEVTGRHKFPDYGKPGFGWHGPHGWQFANLGNGIESVQEGKQASLDEALENKIRLQRDVQEVDKVDDVIDESLYEVNSEETVEVLVEEDDSLARKQWVTCDYLTTAKNSCYDCYTRLNCKKKGGQLKPCTNPQKPYCNYGKCSPVPSPQCVNPAI